MSQQKANIQKQASASAKKGKAILGLGLVQSILGDMQYDIVTLWLDNMRTQCDGLAQVLGSTNPVAKLLKQACLLGPEGIEGVLDVLLVLVIDYPTMDCVCKMPEGQTVSFCAFAAARCCRALPASLPQSKPLTRVWG